MKTCPDCNGDGVLEKGRDEEQQCPRCGGSGFVPDDDDHEEVIKTGKATGAHPLGHVLTNVQIGTSALGGIAKVNGRTASADNDANYPNRTCISIEGNGSAYQENNTQLPETECLLSAAVRVP